MSEVKKGKTKRTLVGTVIKGKNGNQPSILIAKDTTLREGEFLNLETRESQVINLKRQLELGNLSADFVEKRVKELEEKEVKPNVLFQVIKVERTTV